MKKRKRFRRFGLGDTFPLEGEYFERRQPARTGEITGDLVLPMAQAIVSGVAAAAITMILADWRAALVVGVMATGAVWALLLMETRKSLWTVETKIGKDLDHDGYIGKPEPAPVVRVDLVDDKPSRGRFRFLELPLSEAQLVGVARALENGKPFSREGMRRIITQTEYRRLCDVMAKGGLLARLPGNRTVLTGSGRAMFRKVLQEK